MSAARPPAREYVIPGRVELVGKHVDYAGGRSLTCATSLAIRARATAIDEPVIRVRRTAREAPMTVRLSPHARPPKRRSGAYVAAVARRFARDFPYARRGIAIELQSDLPTSAGLSSSAAFVVALAMAFVDANALDRDERWLEAMPTPIARAEYFAAIETGAAYGAFAADGGVGVRGGAQDHVAIVCAQAGMASQFSYMPARLERRVAWPEEMALVIAVSGVHATKTGNAQASYNRLSDQLTTGDREPTAADAGKVARRGQFREETQVIVPGVADALGARDWAKLGALVDRSQHLAERVLGNQVPETIHLTRSARELGAMAASAFGAGFGGAVWATVPRPDAARFVEAWRAAYGRAFPARRTKAKWLMTEPSGAARAS